MVGLREPHLDDGRVLTDGRHLTPVRRERICIGSPVPRSNPQTSFLDQGGLFLLVARREVR